MAYGFKIVDDNGTEFTDSSFSLLTVGYITITGEKTNHQVTIDLELPPNYDISLYPYISYRPTDTKYPTYTDHVFWKTLSYTATKDTVAPYGITYSFNIAYSVIAKRETNSCYSNGDFQALKDATKTTFQLVVTSEY